MKCTFRIPIIFLVLVFACVTRAGLAGNSAQPKLVTPIPVPTPPNSLSVEEKKIQDREYGRKGITVDKPGVYDDAMLQQMLQAAEARLATLQLIDQSQILAKLGAVTGASQQTTGVAFNVTGPSVPGVVTTTKLPTETIKQTTAAGASNSTFETTTGAATEDVQTTRPAFSPPGSSAPSPTTTLPSSGFSVSSSDILNEQMQLNAEINSLRLMLSGDLSAHFMKENSIFGTGVTKLKTTLGFPITLSPDERFKDAVAVVEVEVSQPKKKEALKEAVASYVRDKSLGQGEVLAQKEVESEVGKHSKDVDTLTAQTEDPIVTALLPREKTFNVAAITDKSVSIGGGVATQILGFSGSFLRGHKTYYLVQDQDTVAKSFKPESDHTIGFAWEFRPVLGQRYVRAGLKQTFVQLAFAAPANAVEGEIGTVIVRTYWRKYDRKRGLPKEIIPGSLNTSYVPFNIPRYSLAIRPPAFIGPNIEDAGAGVLQVNLKGRFLPGTYVRIGSKIIATPVLLHEYAGIRFAVPIADVALRDVFLVSHDGAEVPLVLSSCGLTFDPDGVTTRTRKFLIVNKEVGGLDETNSLVKVKFKIEDTVKTATTMNKVPVSIPPDIPGLVLVVGSRVFGYSQLKREDDVLSAVVPTAALNARTELSLQTVFPARGCRGKAVAIGDAMPASSEKLAVLERGKTITTFLLSGSKLSKLEILSPKGARLSEIGTDPEKLRMLTLTAGNLASNKQVLFMRPDGKSFLVTIPDLEPKKAESPRALESITVGADEAFIVGDSLKDVEAVIFRGQQVEFEVIDNNTLRLSRLKALDVTKSASTQAIVLQFKSGARTKVSLRIVDSKVELTGKD